MTVAEDLKFKILSLLSISVSISVTISFATNFSTRYTCDTLSDTLDISTLVELELE